MKRRFIGVELYRYHVFLCVSDRPGSVPIWHRRLLASLGPGMNAEHVYAEHELGRGILYPVGGFPEGSWLVNPSIASLNAIAQAESERWNLVAR